jgi:hypothetical protein
VSSQASRDVFEEEPGVILSIIRQLIVLAIWLRDAGSTLLILTEAADRLIQDEFKIPDLALISVHPH